MAAVLLTTARYGPAGAFKQEITVLHNALSNSGLCGGACERQQNRENDARGIE